MLKPSRRAPLRALPLQAVYRKTAADVLAQPDAARTPDAQTKESLSRAHLERRVCGSLHARALDLQACGRRLHQEQPASCLQRAAVYGVVPDPEPSLCVAASLAASAATSHPVDAMAAVMRRLWDAQERERARDLAIHQLSYPDAPCAGACVLCVPPKVSLTLLHMGHRF